MTSSDAGLSFPVLGFTPDGENWGFPDLDRLTRCGPGTLKENLQDGMELVDAEARRWRVKGIRRTGRAGSILSLLPGFGPPQSRIEHDLEALPDLSLAQVREKARESLEKFRSDYTGYDGDEAEFGLLLQNVAQARSVSELYTLLQPDTFESY